MVPPVPHSDGLQRRSHNRHRERVVRRVYGNSRRKTADPGVSRGILQKQALALQAEFRSFEQAAAAIVKADSLPDPFTGMQILSTLPFVLSKDLQIGIASDGTFASQAWRISEEAYQNISGNKFSWWAQDGKEYTDDRSIFRRPTEQMIRALIMPPILKKGLELGLITFEDEKDNNKA